MHSVRVPARVDMWEAEDSNEELYTMLNLSTLIPRPPHIVTGYLKLDLARAVCLGLKQTIKRRHATREPPKASGLASQTLKTKIFRSCNSTAKRRRRKTLSKTDWDRNWDVARYTTLSRWRWFLTSRAPRDQDTQAPS